MCLAVPGKLLEIEGDNALVDLQGNRLRISRRLTPEAEVGEWVLVHAGFSIARLSETEALETWDYLRGCYGSEFEADWELAEAGGALPERGGPEWRFDPEVT